MQHCGVACMTDMHAGGQATAGPTPGGVQVDPDLQATVFYLALQDGNETAYDLVMQAFMNVSSTHDLPSHQAE